MPAVEIDQFLTPDDLDKQLRSDVVNGLTQVPKTLPPKWFYDERGSQLFEEITRLPEYYPTRAERALLERHAADIAAATRSDTLIELGAGSADKTRLLLTALGQAGVLRRYIPVDVSAEFLGATAAAVAAEYPGLTVHAVVADFERHLHLLPAGGQRLVAFFGSTIGNLAPAERADFLGALAATLVPGDAFLLGVDLVKDPGRLVRAYDDAQGVTAEFNRNVLRVINRELDADFDPASFAHVAVWDPAAEWIEMRLRSLQRQQVTVAALDLHLSFAVGEEMRTEISAKFRPERIAAEFSAAGLAVTERWTDGDFALLLARPA